MIENGNIKDLVVDKITSVHVVDKNTGKTVIDIDPSTIIDRAGLTHSNVIDRYGFQRQTNGLG